MQAISLTIIGRGSQGLAPASATDLVRLQELQTAISGTATVNHTHLSAAITDLNAAVLAILSANGVTLSGTGTLSLLANGGLKYVGSYLGVDSGVVSLRGHTHLSSDISDFNTAVAAWASANGVTLSGTGTVALAAGGGLQYGSGGLAVNSGVVSYVGHNHACTDIVNFSAGVLAQLQASLAASQTVAPSGTGPFSFNVVMAPGGGLLATAAGLGVDLGMAHTQAAYGDHTHALLHNPVTLGAANSISGTISGQQISFEIVPVTGGGLMVTPSGVQVDWSVVQHTGAVNSGVALTTANTTTLQFGYTGSVLSGSVPLDPGPGGGVGGVIVAGANGLYVSLGATSTTAAAGNHVHTAATETSDGFLSASDKVRLDALYAATAPSGVQTASTNTLALTINNANVISGTVLYNTSPIYGKGALGEDVNGLYVALGTASNNAAAGSHLHDTRYLQLTGGVMSGTLTLAADPTSAMQAVTKQYVDNQLVNYLTLAGGAISGSLTVAGSIAIGGTLTLSADPTTNSQAATKRYVDTNVALCLPLAGGALSGTLTLAADPTSVLQAATKQYVDNTVALYLPLTGGTLSGTLVLGSTLTLAADPTAAMQAATKQYVDAIVKTTLAAQSTIADASTTANDPATGAEFNNLVAVVNNLINLLTTLGLPSS